MDTSWMKVFTLLLWIHLSSQWENWRWSAWTHSKDRCWRLPGSAWKILEKRTGKDDQLAVTWAALVKIGLNFTAKKPSSMASIDMIIRTACSSGLVALHKACRAIYRGDCEGAIIGGANLIMAPGMTAAMAEQRVISPDGSCKRFSADVNGYARGEAVSAIFIKPLADAIRDGNPVRAVIRSTASSSDGRGAGAGTHVPNDISHEAMIRRAYEVAGIADYSQTAFVECHGTGTQVGDPVETRAVGRVFGPSGGVLIGSVKPNVGHSKGASGITSLIEAVLTLENQPRPWPEARKERISVNSFGIGGTNAHVVLESSQSFGVSTISTRQTILPQLLVYSANNAESLQQMISNYTDYIQKNPTRVADRAFTLGNRRGHLPHRAFSVKSPLGPLTTSAPSKACEAPSIVMVFTGQGAQWPQMEESIQDLDSHLKTLTHAPEWSIEEELLKNPDVSRLGSSEFSQPVCAAIQVALIDTFAFVGAQPTAVVGHSSGEVAAAYAAGAITAKEAITIAFYRGQVTKLQTRPGAMAAIGMGTEEVQKYIQTGIVVACKNSPESVTLAGDTYAIENAVSRIKEGHPEALARQLKIDKAYHSHHMAEIGDEYYALIEHEVSAKTPNKLFFSSVESKLFTKAQNFGPKYWQMSLQSPVLFLSAVSSIIKHQIAKNMVLLEIGPHSALAGPLRQTQLSFLTAIGQLHVLNAVSKLDRVIIEGSALPACAIALGIVEGVGYAAEQDEILEKLKAAGGLGNTVSVGELFNAVQAAMTSVPSKSIPGTSNFGVGIRPNFPLTDQINRLIWKKDIRMSVFHNTATADTTVTSASGGGLETFITQAKRVFSFLLKLEEDLVTSFSLSELGMDSLVAIEVKQWWKATFEFDISVLELMGTGSLDILGEHAARDMFRLFHGAQEQAD
ncbi:unnamed protein product [Penicillium nalgiovense]|nr:unnamed protein product [Penicillium nalgiovense]